MKWTPKEIKSLRHRMGWSAADFARRFGCLSEVVINWECGALTPTPDDLLQLNRLEFHLESYCEVVIRGPVAEHILKTEGLEQIHQSQLSHIHKN